jgi:predicted DNA-binding protein
MGVRLVAVLSSTHCYGYAAISGPGGVVWAVGRSLGGMLRALDAVDPPPTHYTTIVLTRSAFNMVKHCMGPNNVGHVDIDGLVLFVNQDGVLDAPRRSPGRPPLDCSTAEPSETLSVRLPTSLRARLDRRAAQDGATIGEVSRKALESFLEPPETKARGMLRKLSKGGE